MYGSTHPRRRARRSSSIQRNVFSAHVFGTYVDNTVCRLKQLLHCEGLLESEQSQLELVMLEDVDHFFDLVSEHGIPLARDTDALPVQQAGKVRLEVNATALFLVSAMLVLLMLDDAIKAITGFDLLPWF